MESNLFLLLFINSKVFEKGYCIFHNIKYYAFIDIIGADNNKIW